MPKFQLQKLMQENSFIDLLERKVFELETGIPESEYDNWLQKRRSIGKKKFNRPINRNERRLAIRKKQRYGY